MHSKLVTTILLAAVGLYIIQIVVTFLRRHTDLSSDEQISDVEQRTSFGLEPHERNEILYVITGFKSEPPVMVRDEEEQFEVETAKKQSTVKNSTPSIVWDDTLASEAYNLAIKCPSSNQASLLKGVLTAKSYSRSPSMTEMVNEWSTEFKEYYEKLREDTAVTTEDGNEFDDDTDSVDPERIGCAKTRCFMDRISSTILVCTWKPYTEGVIAV